jgi:predicted metalloendopeptidase
LGAIASLKDKKQLAAIAAALQKNYSVGAFYGLNVQQDQKGSSYKLRDHYVEHVAKTFVVLGDTAEKASVEAKRAMMSEPDLAERGCASEDRSASTGEWRAKGTVQNFDEFGKAFDCKAGQLMMPVNSCRVWVGVE